MNKDIKGSIIECIDSIYSQYKNDKTYKITNAAEDCVRSELDRLIKSKGITNRMDMYITIVQYYDDVHIVI